MPDSEVETEEFHSKRAMSGFCWLLPFANGFRDSSMYCGSTAPTGVSEAWIIIYMSAEGSGRVSGAVWMMEYLTEMNFCLSAARETNFCLVPSNKSVRGLLVSA